jgi:phosphate starvation-inducible PhoH-like protein
MIERIIEICDIAPVDLYGINDSNFEVIRRIFPQVKLVARGDVLKIVGEPSDVDFFTERYYKFVEHYRRFGRLKTEDIVNLSDSDSHKSTNGLNGDLDVLVYGNNGRIIKAMTANQQRMVSEHGKNDLVFAIGPAGCGKTYTAIALAVRSLRNKEVKRIILSRPAVEAGERLGFLPGDLKEKIDPYLQPLYDALNDMLPPRKLESYIEEGVVQIAPLAFMRGRTLDNAFVILDEAQNTTVNQLKMFLTRMGKHSKFIVNGDITQIDLPTSERSGLVHATKILKNIEGISFVELDETDIVRHPLVVKIVKAFSKERKE